MITTNDETLWRRIWEFKDHGKSFDAVYNVNIQMVSDGCKSHLGQIGA